MKEKRKYLILLGLLSCLLIGTIVHAASLSASVNISKGTYQVQTNAVGLSKSALCSAKNQASSETNMTMRVYACWSGWPYSIEGTYSIAPNSQYTYTETQSKDSNFYIQLTGNYKCDGSAKVTAQ